MTRIVPFTFVLALIAPAPALAGDPPAAPPPAPAPAQGTPAPSQPTPPAPAPQAPQQGQPAPTPEQIEAAKKAFAEGKKLHGEGKHAEAIEKFKESYRLSKNPLLLYNIGFTMDEAKEADMALYYYRKFLKEAPADAEQRPTVTERVKALEQQFNPNPTPEQVKTKPEGPKGPIVIKPPGTYSASDFEHQAIETAPPAKPLDVTAFVPDDSGFIVSLFYRTAGEGKYASKVMKWRYKELVARIPAPKMIGTAVQYYIEVKDTTGAVVTRAGKATSPNLVNLESGATARFYPDLTDDGEVLSSTDIRDQDDQEDDPLNRGKRIKRRIPVPTPIEEEGPPPGPRDGFNDVGSTKFTYSKWGSTALAGALIGTSIALYIQAGRYSRFVETDSEECGTPPCRMYDSYSADLAATGKRYQTISQISLGVGAGVAAVAGYFWFKEYRAKKRGELKVSSPQKAPSPEATWFAPALGGGSDGFLGAVAGRRF